HPGIAVAPGAGANARDVAPRARLGHAEGRPVRPLTVAKRSEEPLLLFCRSHRHQRRTAETEAGHRHGHAAIPVRHLLGEQHAAPSRRARTRACGGGLVGADRLADAHLPGELEERMLGRDRRAAAIRLDAERPEVALAELAHAVELSANLPAELELDHESPTS